ncbi:hypothetical protein [Aeromonas hydrophila]|uniref:hypothetical protein n=1 Tax=Aeromonas hydrophila TaxID=644 RepID=UPI00301A1C61
MIFVVDVGFVCSKATGQSNGRLRAKPLSSRHLLRQVALQRQNHPASRAVAPVILGLPLAQHTPRFECIDLQLIRIAAGNQQGSLGNSKRFISTFVAGILLIVLVNVDQLVVIWLQHEHTQKTLSPHLLLTSPIKRRSQRNAVCSAYLRHCLDTRCTFHQEVAHIELQKTDMKNKNIEAASGINIWPTCLSMARQAHC